MIKAIMLIAIVAVGAKIGWDLSLNFTKRVRMIEQLQNDIMYIENEISFKRTQLIDILNGLTSNVSNVFKGQVIAPLTTEDCNIIHEFIAAAGRGDIDYELANIKSAHNRLAINLADAQELKQTQGKMFRTLGVLGGAFVAILFV
ncbi:MAG: stage III sporulation protein AB [Clostridiales bacterium]|jgi:hypothetical protein|nr:stage III sporulation protein AB [Clostridiales bacterium]